MDEDSNLHIECEEREELLHKRIEQIKVRYFVKYILVVMKFAVQIIGQIIGSLARKT